MFGEFEGVEKRKLWVSSVRLSGALWCGIGEVLGGGML